MPSRDNQNEPHVVELFARLMHACVAGAVTYTIARGFNWLDVPTAHEAALVNAGLAYYTDDAVGRVTAAIQELSRAVRVRRTKRGDLEQDRFNAWLREHESNERDKSAL
jgi:hypothetical protein